MKNILNNLSEEEKNAIREQHKDVININTSKFAKLLESKLGDVKPYLNEQAASPATNVWNALKKAIEGIGTNNEGIKSACSMITSAEIYKQLLALANKEGHDTVMDYVLTDFQTPMVDKPIRTERTVNVNYDNWEKDNVIGGMWSKGPATRLTRFCAGKMNPFNPKEGEALWNHASVDHAG